MTAGKVVQDSDDDEGEFEHDPHSSGGNVLEQDVTIGLNPEISPSVNGRTSGAPSIGSTGMVNHRLLVTQ